MKKAKINNCVVMHLCLIAIANYLLNKMNCFEKIIAKSYKTSDERKIELLDKYSKLLTEEELIIYNQNKDRVRFRINWVRYKK